MAKDAKSRRTANLATPNDLGANASKDVAGGLNILLADVIALYFKTKNFHWHVSGPHFRDYHLLLDDQATQIDAMTDVIAERVRKLGAAHDQIGRPRQAPAARARQRRRVRDAVRHAGRAARRQQGAAQAHAHPPRGLPTSMATSPPPA